MKLLYNPLSVSVNVIKSGDAITASSPIPTQPPTLPTEPTTPLPTESDHDNGYVDIEDLL